MQNTSREDNILNRLQNVLGPLKKSTLVQDNTKIYSELYEPCISYQIGNNKKKIVPYIYSKTNMLPLQTQNNKNYIIGHDQSKIRSKVVPNSKHDNYTLRDKTFKDFSKHKNNVKQLLQFNQKDKENLCLSPKYQAYQQKAKYENLQKHQGHLEERPILQNMFSATDNKYRQVSQLTKRNIRNRQSFVNNQTNNLQSQHYISKKRVDRHQHQLPLFKNNRNIQNQVLSKGQSNRYQQSKYYQNIDKKLNYFVSHNVQIKKIVQNEQNEENQSIEYQQIKAYKQWEQNKVQLQFSCKKQQKMKNSSIIAQKNNTAVLTTRLKHISHLNNEINNRIRNIVSTFEQYLSPQQFLLTQ